MANGESLEEERMVSHLDEFRGESHKSCTILWTENFWVMSHSEEPLKHRMEDDMEETDSWDTCAGRRFKKNWNSPPNPQANLTNVLFLPCKKPTRQKAKTSLGEQNASEGNSLQRLHFQTR